MGALFAGASGVMKKGLISSPLFTSDTPSVLLCCIIITLLPIS